MTRPSWPRRRACAVLLAASLLALLVAPGRLGAQQGVVRIYNRTGQPVEILVQNIDAWGARRWRVIARVGPSQWHEFPGVPAGAVFGARSSSRQWRPFRITYPPGAPIFTYTLYPGN